MKTLSILAILCISIIGCKHYPDETILVKQEVFETEKAFAEMAAKSGIAEAFVSFADDDAVLLRNNKLIKGKNAIRAYFEENDLTGTKLVWVPDFVDVATSNDLAYTFGSYTFTSNDENGKSVSKTGFFHTVWKRQKNGSWKFVWD